VEYFAEPVAQITPGKISSDNSDEYPSNADARHDRSLFPALAELEDQNDERQNIDYIMHVRKLLSDFC
jgi:hypothetical protein